jgi:hypothetical protein
MRKYDFTLEKDEEVVLELEEGQGMFHPKSRLHVQMVLTNRRLILLQCERIDFEVSPSKIAEVYGNANLAGEPKLKLKLLDGSEVEIVFWLGFWKPLFFSLDDGRAKRQTVIDRRVSATNRFIVAH